MSREDYLALLDWTARQTVKGKRGSTPKALRPIFGRLSLSPQLWCKLVGSFGRLFYNVAGLPVTIEATTSRLTPQTRLPGAHSPRRCSHGAFRAIRCLRSRP